MPHRSKKAGNRHSEWIVKRGLKAVMIYVSPDDRRLLEHKAVDMGISLSIYTQSAALAAARGVPMEQVIEEIRAFRQSFPDGRRRKQEA